MTPKERAAMQQALGALVRAEAMYGQPNADIQTALRSALADSAASSSEVLAEQEEKPQSDNCCKEADGCPTELAVLQRFWRQAQPQEQSHCKRCNGTGVIPDGVIDFVDGMQLETEIECVRDCPDCTKAQPQGEWIDLTDDEIAVIPNFDGFPLGKQKRIGFARAVIAAYKEKNK